MAAQWFSAPPEWTPDQPNPFTPDGSYGGRWSCFRLTGTDDDWIRNGREPSGLYVAALGARCEHVARRLADFLRYESSVGRSVIVSGTAEKTAEALVAEALALPVELTAIREDDPRWMVHSTTREAWAAIEACGELRSFANLRGDGERAVGELLLNDPPDYAEYIALGEMDKIGPEFVLACRQAGKMLPDPDTEYTPGVRLYFDAHRIIRDGLAVRDGLHPLKVRERLPLEPYLVAAITVGDLPPLPDGDRWTTTRFRDHANEAFAVRNWQPLTVTEMIAVMQNAPFPWWIAGGWAIDLFLEWQTRDHGDIDVLILRRDQLAAQAHLRDWQLHKAKQPGLAPWPEGEFLQPPIHDIWARRDDSAPWAFQLMLMETEGDQWVYRRCPTIRGPIAALGMVTDDGIPYLAPHIQLLYKVHEPVQPKDQADFGHVIERLAEERRAWLLRSLQAQFAGGHEWINQIINLEA